MKKILFIALLLISSFLQATNYYVKTGGSDVANGLSDATAWATVAKVNSIWSANTFVAGDSILFKRGNTFTGTITPTEGGTVSSPIVVGAYGTGSKPIISGFATVSGWTDLGGNIWESSATTCATTLNVVLIDGVVKSVGKYPNTGVLNYEAYSGSASLTDNQLTNTPNWTGAEVVFRANAYNWGRYLISNHTNTVITYTGSTYSDLRINYGYWIQRDPKTLDLDGEWYLDPVTKKLRIYFADNNPNNNVIKASISDYMVNHYGSSNTRNYIHYVNLTLEGANESAILINSTSTGNQILDCDINFSGKNGINTSGAASVVIDGCTINNSLSSGILHSGTSPTITNNIITNSGVLFGMKDRLSGGNGIEVGSSDGALIQYNHVDSTGKHGIFLRGTGSSARNNFIEYAALTHDDVGGIYTTGNTPNSTILNNIILYTTGSRLGCVGTGITVEGIYLDAIHTGTYVEGNTVAHSGRGGLRYHNAYDVTSRNNTLYDNPYNILIVKSDSDVPGYSRNITIRNTKAISKANQYSLFVYNYFAGDPLLFGSSDSNYFARPVDDDYVIKTAKPGAEVNYTLTSWRTATFHDDHTVGTPINPIYDRLIMFYYNETKINKTVTFPSTRYMDVTGVLYTDSIVLTPYTSAVLLPDNSYNPSPEILSIVVLDPPYNTTSRGVTIYGYVTTDGGGTVSERGIVWNTSANPTISNNKKAAGSGLGSYKNEVNNLFPTTIYYLRAYSINEAGTSYSDQVIINTTYSSKVMYRGKSLKLNGNTLRY